MRQTLSEFDDGDDGFGLMGEQRADEFPHRERRPLTWLLAVAVMAVFAGGLWLAYVQGTRHPAATASGEGAPLIRADTSPTKVKPDQPGGMTIPDQNVSIYSEKEGGPPVEKLLPAPEQPMPRPAPAAAAPAPSAVAPSAVPAPSAVAPSAVRVPPTAATAPPVGSAAGKPAAEPKAAATPTHAGPPSPVRIRLASVHSPDAAREEWARLKRDNEDLLGRLTAVAVRADLGDKGIYYRIEAGPLSDPAAAERLCGELKRRQLGCILAR